MKNQSELNAIAQFVIETETRRNPYENGHSRSVAEWSVKLARALKMGEDEIEALRLGALLHDVGKLMMNEYILNKTGKLTSAERHMMCSHPVLGYEVIQALYPDADIVSDVIRHHHENMDGSGYPDGLIGGHISVHARIARITDSYVALTTHRPYRRVSLDSAQTLARLRGDAAKFYDADMLAMFCVLVVKRRGRK